MIISNDKYTIMNGECIKLMSEIKDNSVDLILCDLPYGTTQNKWDSVIPFEHLWANYWRVLKANGVVALTSAQPFTSALVMSQADHFKYQWVWEKTQAVGHLNAWRQPMRKHEDICIFYRKKPTYNPQITDKPKENIRKQTSRTRTTNNYGNHRLDVHKCPPDKSMPSSVLKFANAQKTVHPTQKPVMLMEYLIKTYTNEGDVVLDNCMGSGTTGVACLKTDRYFIGIEMDQSYFSIAKDRISLSN